MATARGWAPCRSCDEHLVKCAFLGRVGAAGLVGAPPREIRVMAQTVSATQIGCKRNLWMVARSNVVAQKGQGKTNKAVKAARAYDVALSSNVHSIIRWVKGTDASLAGTKKGEGFGGRKPE